MDAYPEEVWFQFLVNLSLYIDSRVSYSGRHSTQVAHWVRATARRLHCSESETQAVYWAAQLHDVGKIGIPDNVLSKAGPLTDAEWSMMRLHPAVGANIVKAVKLFEHIAPYIYYHQERYDGSGYPEGLAGEAIPIGARILAVADAYDAMTNDRFYRSACNHEEAIFELRSSSGKHFDPQIVNVFLEVVDAELEEIKNPAFLPHENKKSFAHSGTKDSSAVPPCLPGVSPGRSGSQ